MKSTDLDGKVALVTGASSGIGAAVARRLASLGAHIVAADIQEDAGRAIADELDGAFVRCDVRDPADSEAAVAVAVERFGGLDLVHLNAGISTGTSPGPDFDLEQYRRAMSINLDGVVFGVQAALPALRARGAGAVIATASMAGLVAVPFDPIYAANKHAVVGLCRSLGPVYAPEGILVNALCPSFADTPIIGGAKEMLEQAGFPILPVEAVVDAFVAILDAERSGECWYVIPGREPAPFEFRNAPGPRD